MIKSLIISLVLTLLIEVTVAIILGIRQKKDIIVVICANVCTNPIVVYISNLILLLNNNILYSCAVIILEISAWIIEFLLYKKYLRFNKISPLKISLICNIVSFGTGLIINIL